MDVREAVEKAITEGSVVTLHVKGARPMHDMRGNPPHWYNYFRIPGYDKDATVAEVCKFVGIDPQTVQNAYFCDRPEFKSDEEERAFHDKTRQTVTNLFPFREIRWFRDSGRKETFPSWPTGSYKKSLG